MSVFTNNYNNLAYALFLLFFWIIRFLSLLTKKPVFLQNTSGSPSKNSERVCLRNIAIAKGRCETTWVRVKFVSHFNL